MYTQFPVMDTFNLKLLWLRIIPAFAFTLLSFNVKPVPGKKIIKWAVQQSSTLRIMGATNVSTFGCDIKSYHQPDTIFCSEENAAYKMVTLKGKLTIDVSSFDCHNKMLTCDLRKTLKADQYPQFVINFLSLERAPVIHGDKDFLNGWVEIQLAGVTRTFEVSYAFNKSSTAAIHLNGSRDFSFADFKLSPPKKMAGIIKVKDHFNVDFNLLLIPVE